MFSFSIMFNNHVSKHKDHCREIINNIIKQGDRVFTMPSTNFILESDIIDKVRLHCAEYNKDVYRQQMDLPICRSLLEKGMTLVNTDSFVALKDPGDPFRVVWLDLCGPLNLSTVSKFLSFIQTGNLQNESYVAFTFALRRESNGNEIVEFYGCKNLSEFRDNVFPKLVTEFAEMAGKSCRIEHNYSYNDTGTPMRMLVFKLEVNG